jgi:hypothetical protein
VRGPAAAAEELRFSRLLPPAHAPYGCRFGIREKSAFSKKFYFHWNKEVMAL